MIAPRPWQSPSAVTLCLSVCLCLLVSGAGSAQVAINEVVTSNHETIRDEDGDSSDWIEFSNTGDAPVNLEGYGLSDNLSPFRWVFPSAVILPRSHLLVFASGKDRREGAPHWETVIDWGDEWKYVIPVPEPDPAWRLPGFQDTSWATGQTGIGYGDGDDRTEVPSGLISIYARKTFQVADPAEISHVFLDIDFDDGFVAFLNGEEIARENLEDLGRPPLGTETASGSNEARLKAGGSPSHYAVTDFSDLLRAGENVLAIQVHNSSASSSDLTLIPFLTLGMEAPPSGARGLAELLRPQVPALHTSFKLDADGESITLTSPARALVDAVESGSLPTDVSIGRFPDGTGPFSYHNAPTPGGPNTSAGFEALSGAALFSSEGGFYPGGVSVAIEPENPAGDVYFTLDGSVPTQDSARYQSPIQLNSTTVVRARVLAEGALPGQAVTHTFFIDEGVHLPVVSISTDPENFFDNEIGIYVLGDSYESSFPHFGANFWEDWERPVHVEFFETDGSPGFSLDAGAKIFGGWSRGHPQKSLSIFARKEYGAGRIRYRLFPGKDIDSFEAFVLRNSGNDWQITHLRDAMMTSLLDAIEVDRQAYRPVVVFINGDYWGIMNLREKVNEHFVEANHPEAPADQVDLLESNARVIHGDAEHYSSLISLLQGNPASSPAIYSQVKGMMDVTNFIDYQAAQIYYDNTDWPGNNIKYWRSRTADGRWRWIMFDTDFGFGIWNTSNYTNNTLAFALEPNGPGWPNPPWSTFLLRQLVTNDEFLEDFVNRFATHLSTIFESGKVIQRVDDMASVIEAEMPAQRRRWGGSVSDWFSKVQVLRTFASRRANYVRSHLASRFGLGRPAVLRLDVSPPGGGVVEVQGIGIPGYPWEGTYFQGTPVRLTARPYPGFIFTRWEGISPMDEAAASVVLSGSRHEVTAGFRLDCDAAGSVVINEINYNAPDDRDPGDWVELHNPTVTVVDLSGWEFRDESDDHVYTLPPGTLLEGGEYLVLCSDTAAFSALFPSVTPRLGDLGFSLAGDGELLRLFDASESIVDLLTYGDADPWPEAADGNGSSLALRNPFFENAAARFWSASPGGGTPGSRNDVFEEVESNCATRAVAFLRGDSNGDGIVDVSDAIRVLRFLFLAEGRLDCVDAGDANDDGSVDILDPLATLLSLFTGNVELPAPGTMQCGPDPTWDPLECRSHPACAAGVVE